MLKDLDNRQADQQTPSQAAINALTAGQSRSSTKLVVIVTVIATLILVSLAYLYFENQNLKQQQAQPVKSVNANASYSAEQLPNKLTEQTTTLVTTDKSSNIPAEKSTKVIAKKLNTNDPVMKKALESTSVNNQPTNTTAELGNEQNNRQSTEQKIEQTIEQVPQNNLPDVDNAPEPPKAKLSISRKKLTPKELAEQKMQLAENSMLANNIEKAEGLFEEVLLLMPTHQAARKQLAALWYGRKAYQPAINILAQGVQLYPEDSEFRLMQARVFLSRGQSEQALRVLNGLNEVNDIEYLSTQANIAQKVNQFDTAIGCYQKLVQIQPAQARWFLGLAIALDSNSQFEQALINYQTALALDSLSSSSREFAQQRVLELGE